MRQERRLNFDLCLKVYAVYLVDSILLQKYKPVLDRTYVPTSGFNGKWPTPYQDHQCVS